MHVLVPEGRGHRLPSPVVGSDLFGIQLCSGRQLPTAKDCAAVLVQHQACREPVEAVDRLSVTAPHAAPICTAAGGLPSAPASILGVDDPEDIRLKLFLLLVLEL